ncbi:hypothetical protein B4Q13_21220, partial [Lacticaseibacillus rhamnosus]
TGRLIDRIGKSLFVLAVFTSTLNAMAPLLVRTGQTRHGRSQRWRCDRATEGNLGLCRGLG